MYYIKLYGISGPSLLIESTNSVITVDHESFVDDDLYHVLFVWTNE